MNLNYLLYWWNDTGYRILQRHLRVKGKYRKLFPVQMRFLVLQAEVKYLVQGFSCWFP